MGIFEKGPGKDLSGKRYLTNVKEIIINTRMDQNFKDVSTEADTSVTTVSQQDGTIGVAGFIIAMIALVFLPVGWLAAVGLEAISGNGNTIAVIWLVFSITGTSLSATSLLKLRRTDGAIGLSIAGIVVGVVAIAFSFLMIADL